MKVLEALSNPYRLKIVGLLSEERKFVSQLAKELNISRPLLYLHLKKLEEVKLIEGSYEISANGKTKRYFELNSFHIPLDERFISRYTSSLTVKRKTDS
ncbi:ArsR/SmtB family transcription factor [Alkalicoccus luteus]|uniref:ArsR/SmtB family transcription factor n=1 Tax=Alkalicoccus luteus TaxID=1237094 RepID=UPI001FEC1EFB|nr:winged helix-turn-helix domain-containing protein [Alkalicoccus luteus]